MKKLIKEMGYVCSPSNISIKLKCKLVNRTARSGSGVEISIFDGARLLFSEDFASKALFRSRFEYDQVLKEILEYMFRYTRKDFIQYVLKDKMQGIYFYDNLKKVRNKLGTIVFKKR